MSEVLAFEEPVALLEEQLAKFESQGFAHDDPVVIALKKKIDAALQALNKDLKPWQKLALARHPSRPHGKDYIEAIFDDFDPLYGDRMSGECGSVVAGLASFQGSSVMVLAQQKGHDLASNLSVNFGMPKPCAYRKVKRLLLLAQRFSIPIITLLDSPGADAGVQAEIANQSEAIAENMLVMSELSVPIVTVVVGEAMSGGAMAMGIADRIFMLEHSVFSVISPEGCSAILWRDPAFAKEAASKLGITAQDLLAYGLVDGIISEPIGGAHRDRGLCFQLVKKAIADELITLKALHTDDLLSKRYRKWMLPSLVS